jgi:hypothetical protein
MAGAVACGPSVDLAAGVKNLPTDVLLGAPVRHAVAQHPDDVPVPSFPGVTPTAPEPPPEPVVPPVPVLACPPADPNAFPPRAATQSLNRPPAPGRYAYRQRGTAKADGKRVASLPRKATWTVRKIEPPLPTQPYAFSVTSPSFQGATTTTDYAVMKPVINISQTIPATNIGIQPIGGGIYVTRIVTRSHGATTTFTPLTPGVQLIGQPLVPKATWTSIGVDIVHSLTMTVRGEVVGKTQVNACGQKLDAWRVKVATTIFGLSENLTQTERYDVGSEYGGLLLSVRRSIAGTTGGQRVEQEMSATINSVKPVKSKPAARRR